MQMNSQNTSQTNAESESEYVRKWNKHISELKRLGLFLGPKDKARVDELQDELREIVAVAEENKQREERDGVLDAEYVTHTGGEGE